MAEFNALMGDLRIVPPVEPNALLQPPTMADAWSHNVQAATDWMERERQISRDQGLWTGGSVFEGGHPTQAGALDAVRQASMNLLMGSTAPGFSLHPIPIRPTRKIPNKDAFTVKGPDGEDVGIIDTTWNPETRDLRIEDIQSNEGKNTLGLSAIRQLRDMLLERFPEAKTLSGQRITGAVSADRNSGASPGREAVQRVTE